MNKVAALHVFRGNYGLPSIDPTCLQMIFQLRLHADHSVEVKTCRFCTSPIKPYLKYMNKRYYHPKTIFYHIPVLVQDDCDRRYALIERGKILAYKEYANSVLGHAIVLHFWGWEDNNRYLTKLYGEGLFFPFRILFNRRFNSYHQNLILDLTESSSFNEQIKANQTVVENFLTHLTELLRENKYLLGDKPCSLDAFICGYLAPIIVLKLPNSSLYNIVQGHVEIVQYVKNFMTMYGDEYTGNPPEYTVTKVDEFERAPLSTLAVAAFVAISTMVCFAITHNIIKT